MDDHDGGPRTGIEQTLRAFARHGDAEALTLDTGGKPERWTYRDLLDRVHREARRLDGLGVGRGDVVAVLTGDDPRTFVLRWAANVLGAAVTVPTDGLAAPVLTRLLDTCGARWLLADTARHELGVAAGSGTVRVVDVEATPPPDDASPVPVRAQPDDLASISLTGGTTGVPKGVPRRAAVPPGHSPEALAGWTATVQLLCSPVAHLGGTLALRTFTAGGRVVLQPAFDPARVADLIGRERVTMLFLLPRLLHRLLDEPRLAGADTSTLRAVYLGGAPASSRRIGEALERFGPVVAQGYGTIEATNISWLTAEELARPELRSTVGRPMPGVELSIRGDDGGELPSGEVGRVLVRSPGVTKGYLNAPDETAAALSDGWLDTGDLGHLDGDGYLSLVGRRKDVILAEHANLYPGEIEEALLRHPGVASAAVFAEHGPDGDERAAAAVVPSPGQDPTPAGLVDWVRERLGPSMVPSTVHLVDDLPLLPTAKVDRAALRRRLTGIS